MSFERLLNNVHRASAETWTRDNEEAFSELFGSEGGRYPRAANKSIKIRAPAMNNETGVSFAAYIHPANPTSGPYSGLSFAIFPVPDGPCLIGLVIGTQGLAPDEAILARPGHARKVRAICSWLNARYGNGRFIAWAKHDPTRTDLAIPDPVVRSHHAYKSVFERYGKELYAIYAPTEDESGTRAAVACFLDLLFEERGFLPVASAEQDRVVLQSEWIDYLMPDLNRTSLVQLLSRKRYVILQGPPGTGKTLAATDLLQDEYRGCGTTIQFHSNTTYENFIGGLTPVISEDQLGLRFAPTAGFLMRAAATAVRDPSRNFLLHIDEINRADFAKVLGEALILLEPTANRTVELAYDFGEPFGRKLFLPPNLHILGTMNSTDRSIAIADVAVRRRFSFVSVWPKASVVEQYDCLTMQKAFRDLLSIFIEYATDESMPLVPGHSYFMEANEELARENLKVNLAPLLEEYLAQGYVSGFAEYIQSYLQELQIV